MNVGNRFIPILAVAGGVAALSAACATREPLPTAEMSRASTLIEQAETSGAQQQAGTELAQARDKLHLAQSAADQGKPELARRLATEAAADAELANARGASAKAQQAAEEVRRSIESLQNEVDRSAATPASLPPPDVSSNH